MSILNKWAEQLESNKCAVIPFYGKFSSIDELDSSKVYKFNVSFTTFGYIVKNSSSLQGIYSFDKGFPKLTIFAFKKKEPANFLQQFKKDEDLKAFIDDKSIPNDHKIVFCEKEITIDDKDLKKKGIKVATELTLKKSITDILSAYNIS